MDHPDIIETAIAWTLAGVITGVYVMVKLGVWG